MRGGSTPPDVFGGQNVHHFEVTVTGEALSARHVRAFGEREGAGRLFVVETIAVDAEHDQVLVADETTRDVKVYTLDGRYTGRAVGGGLFHMQPEGIVLAGCAAPAYWVMTDQNPCETSSMSSRVALSNTSARSRAGARGAPTG